MEKKKRNPKSLANLRPIKKGEVRNPLGINRKRPLTDRMYEQIEAFLRDTPEGRAVAKKFKLPLSATNGDAIVSSMIKKARAGDVRAIVELRNSIEGKPPERLEISGPARKEITIHVKYDRTKPSPNN